MGAAPVLVTAVGDDAPGLALRASLSAALPSLTLLTPAMPATEAGGAGAGTAQYVALLDGRGDLVAAVADMAILDRLSPGPVMGPLSAGGSDATSLAQLLAASPPPPFLVCDANVPAATVGAIGRAAAATAVPSLFEAISVAKCSRLVDGDAVHAFAVVKCNR
jgi:hypothetical protein